MHRCFASLSIQVGKMAFSGVTDYGRQGADAATRKDWQAGGPSRREDHDSGRTRHVRLVGDVVVNIRAWLGIVALHSECASPMSSGGNKTQILLYGAYGYTGRLTAELAASQSRNVVLAGRNEGALAALG